MKVQAIQQQNNRKSPQFKNGIDGALRFFATNQAWGANGVDVCFMVMPRTASDGFKRGPLAGMETFRREIMGTVNDTLIGMYGFLAGSIVANLIMKKFNIGANTIFTAPETMNILSNNRAEQLKNNLTRVDYLKNTLKHVKAYNPSSSASDSKGYIDIAGKTIDEVAELFDKAIDSNMKYKDWIKNKTAGGKKVIINKITEATGAQSEYILSSANGKEQSVTNLDALLNDIFKVTKSFDNSEVKKAFDEQVRSGKSIKDNAFVKSILKFMKTRAGIGFAMAALVGVSVQPMNMYISKRKTGSDGFVGVAGRTKDKSTKFKVIKAISSAAFLTMILGTLKSWPQQFMEKMSFKGKMPTINQLKGVYGITIVSRIFSARDKDELREVLTKDTLGYLSWLVLGDIVNRITAQLLDKSVINFKKDKKQSKWVLKEALFTSLKTRDEILIETLAKNNIETTKNEGRQIKAKTFKEMVKDLDKLPEAVRKTARKRLNTLNKAQCAGYLFSGLVLGLGIPNLNIYITNKLDKKRKLEAAKLAETSHQAA